MASLTISSRNRVLPAFLHEIGRILASIAAGSRAARDYRHLTSRTNAALAREGIARNDIPRLVLERNFG